MKIKKIKNATLDLIVRSIFSIGFFFMVMIIGVFSVLSFCRINQFEFNKQEKDNFIAGAVFTIVFVIIYFISSKFIY